MRLQSELTPLVEGIFALAVLHGPQRNDSYARWRVDLQNMLRQHGCSIRRPALRSAELLDDLVSLLEDEPSTGRTRASFALEPAEAVQAALDVWKLGVSPYWSRIRERLDTVCDSHGRLAALGGVERLLSTLHPRIIWNPPVLEIHDGPDREIALNGRGLILKPSVFLLARAGRFVELSKPTLVFAASQSIVRGWDEAPAPDPARELHSLAALVGNTRAAILRALIDTSTTSQLAENLGISQGTASQHTGVLRESGLITTRRVRTSALHTVTPLGMALLTGQLSTRFPAIAVQGTDQSEPDRVPPPRCGIPARGAARCS
ncbi:ArsR/SmtB family transcription factor [Streptomyces sp. NPDC052042]|uniref:ArsR/SmtB family transcription factor n=1 Tax=Streptomyces sp. NPDC052042 TaxID=3365683 RepID=UPI0037D52251